MDSQNRYAEAFLTINTNNLFFLLGGGGRGGRSKKNNVYPCKPHFQGLRGSKFYRHVFAMIQSDLTEIVRLNVKPYIYMQRKKICYQMEYTFLEISK